jgi:hypothetical protein
MAWRLIKRNNNFTFLNKRTDSYRRPESWRRMVAKSGGMERRTGSHRL